MPAVRDRGRIYRQVEEFDQALNARQTAAADQMLAAWTESYRNVRQELDRLVAKVETARAAGVVTSPAWAYQEKRLKHLLDVAATEVGRYSKDAATATQQTQAAAIQQATIHARKLAQTAAATMGLDATFVQPNPRALIRTAVGFTGDGSVLANHLARTLAPEVVGGIRATVLKGLTLGKGPDWFVREVTRGYALAHSRAETIMRTETLRVYRETSKATYDANDDVLEGWTWQAHLDARTCIACALMDGTFHELGETLDGHPRCRCAMVPRTKSWDALGFPGLEDTRPVVPSGRAWVESQPPTVQRAMMGRAKFDAWQAGEISLDDMVAQHADPDWGTMRTERSLVAIREGRNPNPDPLYLDNP